MNLIEKILERYLRKFNIITLAIVIIFSTVLLIFADGFIRANFQTVNLFGKNFLIIGGVLYPFFLFVLLILLVIFLLFLWGKFSYYKSIIFSRNEIILMPAISKWKFQGSLRVDGESLAITSSDLGCLMEGHLYKNFVMTFNAKIINGGRLGIIFRGQDLENYLMLQIELCDCNGTRIYDIVPYVRLWGDLENFRPYFRTGEGFLHKYRKLRNDDHEKDGEKLTYNFGNGILVNLKVQNYIASIKISSDEKEEEFCWDIPTHTKPNIISSRRKEKKEEEEAKPEEEVKSEEEEKINNKSIFSEQKSASNIWFRNEYGKIGFRANLLEKAIIRDLKIQKI